MIISMKKIISTVLALLICASAAGCRNSDDIVVTVTEISSITINDPVAFESAVSEYMSEKFSENEASAEQTAVPDIAENSESSETASSAGEQEKPVYSPEEISGSGRFDAALLKEIAKQNDNFVISPLSVKLALNMAALGAGENSDTERELLDLFGYGSRADMVSDSENLISELNRKDGSITVNDSVWISNKKDISVSKEFTRRLEEIFNAEKFRKDLSGKKIVKEFNKWVKDKTNGLIPEMISQPFDEAARVVLVNTLYFNNEWKTKFPEYNSYEFKFMGVNSENLVMAMNVKSNFEYAEGRTFKGVVLPYEDGSKMKVYLPMDENGSLAEIIGSLSPEQLSKELELDYTMEKTIVCMPRFECDYKDSLVETLKLLGVSAAFDGSAADFSGMLEEGSEYPLYISDVIHASKIKCGEKGTEAAAVTVVEMDTGSAMPLPEEPPKEFVANRPFLYMIESPSGEVLFMGIISEL